MGARGVVRLGTVERTAGRLSTADRPGRVVVSRPDYPATKLPFRTRALLIIGLALLAWVPVLAAGYVIAVWI
jgi:hypothetical protein